MDKNGRGKYYKEAMFEFLSKSDNLRHIYSHNKMFIKYMSQKITSFKMLVLKI